MKKVTEIISYYNEEKYLETAVRSIMDQSYEDIELILVNDGSTDKSEKIAKNFPKNPPPLTHKRTIIHISNDKNRGQGYCRNQGLEAATGDYVGFFDADDIADRYKVEKQVRYLENHKETLVVSGNYDCIDKEGNIISGKMEGLELEDADIRARMLFGNCIANSGSLFRRDVIDRYGVRNISLIRVSQDYHFWLNCMQYGGFYNMEDVLFHYRINHNSQTQQIRKRDEHKWDEVMIKIFEYAWNTRGFRLEKDDFVFIFTYLYRTKRLWRLKDMMHALSLYRKIRVQAKTLELCETDKILLLYRNGINKCMAVTKGIRKVESIFRS